MYHDCPDSEKLAKHPPVNGLMSGPVLVEQKNIMFTETLIFVRQVRAESAVMDPSNIRSGILCTSNNP